MRGRTREMVKGEKEREGEGQNKEDGEGEKEMEGGKGMIVRKVGEREKGMVIRKEEGGESEVKKE